MAIPSLGLPRGKRSIIRLNSLYGIHIYLLENVCPLLNPLPSAFNHYFLFSHSLFYSLFNKAQLTHISFLFSKHGFHTYISYFSWLVSPAFCPHSSPWLDFQFYILLVITYQEKHLSLKNVFVLLQSHRNLVI